MENSKLLKIVQESIFEIILEACDESDTISSLCMTENEILLFIESLEVKLSMVINRNEITPDTTVNDIVKLIEEIQD